jgi:hypothetical protein
VHVFVPLWGKGVVLLGFRYPPHSVEHCQSVSVGAYVEENTNGATETAYYFVLRTFHRLHIASVGRVAQLV